jgi:hypothetical protein
VRLVLRAQLSTRSADVTAARFANRRVHTTFLENRGKRAQTGR